MQTADHLFFLLFVFAFLLIFVLIIFVSSVSVVSQCSIWCFYSIWCHVWSLRPGLVCERVNGNRLHGAASLWWCVVCARLTTLSASASEAPARDTARLV